MDSLRTINIYYIALIELYAVSPICKSIGSKSTNVVIDIYVC